MQGESRGVTKASQALFGLEDLLRHGGHLGGDRRGDQMHSMAIPMKQIAWPDSQAADLDRFSKLDDVSVGVRYGGTAGEEMKAELLDLLQIAHGTVGDAADAVQRQGDAGMNLADEGADARYGIEVLHDDHARLGNGREVVPPVHAVVVATPAQGRIGSADDGRRGVAQHVAHPRKLAAGRSADKAFIARANLEALNGVGSGAGAEQPQAFEF